MIASRYTPILGPLGTQVVALGGTTALLRSLLTVPPNAAQAVVQGVGATEFAFRLDASEGEAAADCLRATTITLANGESIRNCVVCSSGSATEVVVQFYAGAIGP